MDGNHRSAHARVRHQHGRAIPRARQGRRDHGSGAGGARPEQRSDSHARFDHARTLTGRRSTVVLAGLTLLVLVLSLPGSLRDAFDRGEICGRADARAGRPPYLYGVLFHRSLRAELVRSGFDTRGWHSKSRCGISSRKASTASCANIQRRPIRRPASSPRLAYWATVLVWRPSILATSVSVSCPPETTGS